MALFILSVVWSAVITVQAGQVQAPVRMEFTLEGSGRPASASACAVIVGVNPNKPYKEIGGLESEPTIKGD